MRMIGLADTTVNLTYIPYRNVRFFSIIAILCLIPFLSLIAQQNVAINIKGKVINKETGLPMEYVNVFLANTTIGTTTEKNGEFLINSAPVGSYDVVFTLVGFVMQKRHIEIYADKKVEFSIELTPKPLYYTQIDVVEKTPEDWKDNLETFTDMFLGDTDNADKTKILNPEVLSFKVDKKLNMLKAYSDSVLKIENSSLGYLIDVVLDSLTYNKSNKSIKYVVYSRFHEMTSKSKEDSLEWQKNRQETFLNSPRYFFYQLVNKKLYRNEFKLYTGSISDLLNREGTPIKGQDLDISTDQDSTVYNFKYSGCLKVKRSSQISVLSFYKWFTEIDRYGNFLKPFYTVEIFGYWGKQGIADSLPLNYIYKEE
jgi:hypothetical protein